MKIKKTRKSKLGTFLDCRFLRNLKTLKPIKKNLLLPQLDEFVVDAGAESAVYDGVVYTPCLGGPSRGAVLDARLLVLDTRRARLEETVRRNRARNSHHRSVSPGPDLSVWRPWAGSLLEAKVVGCWCCCLSEARCRQLCDLHINSMTYTLFFIPDYQFQKVFLCFIG